MFFTFANRQNNVFKGNSVWKKSTKANIKNSKILANVSALEVIIQVGNHCTLLIIFKQVLKQETRVPNDGGDSASNDGDWKLKSISGEKLSISIP